MQACICRDLANGAVTGSGALIDDLLTVASTCWADRFSSDGRLLCRPDHVQILTGALAAGKP